MELFLSISVGLGLAAACGFRIFIPLLLVGAAHHTGHMELADQFLWIASTPAMIGFGVATLLEIGAYYIPFLDNLLDTLAGPSAVIAGTIVTASQVAAMDPWMSWSIAIIGGGGAAGIVQGATTFARSVSSVATAGFGNPILSTAEAGASVVMTFLAIMAPLAAVICIALVAFWLVKRFFFTPAPQPPVAA